MTDYRDLLKRYMRVVRMAEGTTFLDAYPRGRVNGAPTALIVERDLAELRALEQEGMRDEEQAAARPQPKPRSGDGEIWSIEPSGMLHRLTHEPSGEPIFRALTDFNGRAQARACLDRILAATPDVDWSSPDAFRTMPDDVRRRMKAAIDA